MKQIGKTVLMERSRRRWAYGPKAFVLLTLLSCLMVGAYPRVNASNGPEAAALPVSAQETVSGRVTHVRDGDTIEIGQTAIRLRDLDCAERGTDQGKRATELMRALVREAPLTCDLSGRKSYDRYVGQCRLADGRELAQVMIETKTCQRFR